MLNLKWLAAIGGVAWLFRRLVRPGLRLRSRAAGLAAGVAFASLSAVAGADPAYVLITILHTNDLHGSVAPGEGPGGLARAATVVRQIRAEMPNVLLLEGGDVIHGQPEDYLSGGAATISAMNAVGYDVMTAGNHEFDFGLQVTQDAMRRASFPFLAANIRAASGGQWDRLQPHIIKEIQGVRVAIFGLATLDTITLHWPPSISDIFIDDPIETAKRVVPELRKQADVVIALSHMGVNPDKQMAAEVPGIDFIVGAHTHTTIPEWTWIGDTLVTQTGYGARNLGRIDFIVRKDGDSADLRSVNGRHTLWNNLQNVPLDASYPEGPLIAIAEDLPEDPDVLKAYQPYRDRAAALAREVIGSASAAVLPAPAGQESAAANLVADAVRAAGGSDLGVVDANSVKGELAAGPVTAGQAFGLIGGYTRQHLVTAKMTGDEIIAGLNARAARKKLITTAISGASTEWEMKGDTPVVKSLTIGGQPAGPEKLYTVTAQAYVMMEMMEAAPGVEITWETWDTTREAVVSHIKERKTVSPPDLDRIRRVGQP